MATVGYRLRESFRLPAGADPAPGPGRLLGVCVWAAALGLLGLPVAARTAVALATGAPAWLGPVMTTVGVLGITVTGAAFAAIHHRNLPWKLLAAASVALAVNAGLALV